MLRQTGSDSFTDPQFIFMQRPVIKEVSLNFTAVTGLGGYFDQRFDNRGGGDQR